LKEIQRIARLRKIFSESSKGRGLASSLVTVFKPSGERSEEEVARMILLGFPPARGFRLLLGSEEGSTKALVDFMASGSRVNVRNAGRRAEKLAIIFERWARMRERRILEQKVLELRGHIISAILGAVLAFLSSLAPFISSFQLFGIPAPSDGNLVVYAGGSMAIVSSAFLGSFLSSRRRYLDPIIAAGAFLLAVQMIAPLTNIPAPSLGAIK